MNLPKGFKPVNREELVSPQPPRTLLEILEGIAQGTVPQTITLTPEQAQRLIDQIKELKRLAQKRGAWKT